MITEDQIRQQLQFCFEGGDFGFLGERIKGKVRDSYVQGGQRVIVVSDRLSAFDKNICLVPFKGQVLNEMAKFWFEETKDICENHVIDYPDPNVTVGKECKVFPVEFVVRGYITGSSWRAYEKGERNFCGNVLPEGLKEGQKFDQPIITPTTKAEMGEHDEPISREEIIERGLLEENVYDQVADFALKFFARGQEIAAKQGVILVDTKYEFGFGPDGEIVVVDEMHTPDSSRFWYANEYEERFEAGEAQKKIDKDYVRNWLADRGFMGDGEVPEVTDEVRVEAARRYIEAYELITGQEFVAEVGDVAERIKGNLQKYAM